GVRTRFRVSLDSNDFPEFGVWDTFIRARWGTKTLVENFGHSKSKSVDTQPVLLGSPTHAAALFTPSGTFALDVGPTAINLSRDHHIRPRRVGRFVVGRDEITELNGVHSDLISATVRSKESGKTTEVRMVKHQGTRRTHLNGLVMTCPSQPRDNRSQIVHPNDRSQHTRSNEPLTMNIELNSDETT